ncbi:response regulator [Sphaerisporangium viridialbum]|uniref:response regulator n=1 Tax=Sphaerisporangium viridialbum TaxID=46189 RepID=UPI003C7791B3
MTTETPGTEAPIRIVIVDDHPLMREGLRALVASLPDIEIVGEAGDGDAARRQAQLTRPDVVVMDLHMPGTNGVEATRAILRSVPDTRVLVLTMFEDDESVFTAMRAGASGYLVKGAQQDEIIRALRSVAAGQAVFGPSVARRIIGFFAGGGHPALAVEPFPELTAREREILDLIAAGLPNAAIARRLVISGKTVSNHISAIFAKLQVADRAEAIIRAPPGRPRRRPRAAPRPRPPERPHQLIVAELEGLASMGAALTGRARSCGPRCWWFPAVRTPRWFAGGSRLRCAAAARRWSWSRSLTRARRRGGGCRDRPPSR